jgi:hypothetical protein
MTFQLTLGAIFEISKTLVAVEERETLSGPGGRVCLYVPSRLRTSNPQLTHHVHCSKRGRVHHVYLPNQIHSVE